MRHFSLALILTLGPICNLKAQGLPHQGPGMMHAQGGGGTPPAFSATATGCTTGGTSCTISFALTAGDFVVVCESDSLSTDTLSITGSINTYTNSFSKFIDSGTLTGTLCATTVATTTATETITCTNVQSAGFTACGAQKFTGTLTAIDVAAATASFLVTNTWTTGTTGTTGFANELIVNMFTVKHTGSFPDCTLGSGYTNLGQTDGTGVSACMQSKVVSSTGTFSGTMTQTASTIVGGAAIAMAYKGY